MLHSLRVIAVVIVVFLEIHPFRDGNGRPSRVLTTLLLLRAGYIRQLMAGHYSLLPLAVYLVSGRWFVRGITAGAVKG